MTTRTSARLKELLIASVSPFQLFLFLKIGLQFMLIRLFFTFFLVFFSALSYADLRSTIPKDYDGPFVTAFPAQLPKSIPVEMLLHEHPLFGAVQLHNLENSDSPIKTLANLHALGENVVKRVFRWNDEEMASLTGRMACLGYGWDLAQLPTCPVKKLHITLAPGLSPSHKRALLRANIFQIGDLFDRSQEAISIVGAKKSSLSLRILNTFLAKHGVDPIFPEAHPSLEDPALLELSLSHFHIQSPLDAIFNAKYGITQVKDFISHLSLIHSTHLTESSKANLMALNHALLMLGVISTEKVEKAIEQGQKVQKLRSSIMNKVYDLTDPDTLGQINTYASSLL